ncbi:MAG: MiaB/RimO family radical SAM methylthiotransferase [bacterium]
MHTKKRKTYFLHVYGCQMNVSDAERMASLLERLGFEKTDREQEADLLGVVACSVRQAPIDRIYGQANKWKRMKQERGTVTMLSGCVLDHDKPTMAKIFDIMFPINNLGRMPSLLSEHFGSGVMDANPATNEYCDIPPSYNSSFRAFVPISSGCNKFCTYCAVPYTRGGEISRSPESILDEIRHLVDHGYKEVTLLGQNVNSYGLDFEGVSLNLPNRQVLKYRKNALGELEVHKRPVHSAMGFPALLRAINDISGDFWVRFMTSHPYDMSDELVETVAAYNKLTHAIHLPAQAGSNETLRRMNRLYTIEHYRERLAAVRRAMPDAYVTTDIIVGFCGEMLEDFAATTELMEEAEYDMAFISPYSTRQGTAASRMRDDVPKEEKERRFNVLNDVLARTALRHNTARIGTTDRMLVEEYRKGINIGRLKNGRKANFRGSDRMGNFVDVRITDATPWHVVVELVNT